MITVHYLENSRAHRILWLLEELGLAYEVEVYRRGPDLRAPAALKRIHPLGKSPVVVDDGRVLAESGAIIEHLLDAHGGEGLRPAAGGEAHRRYVYWLHYAEGSAMPLLLLKLLFSRLPGQAPLLLRPMAALIANGVMDKLVDPQLADHVAYWEAELARDGFFAGGTFTAADIAMSFPVETAMSRASGVGATPAIRRYLDAVRDRPAYARALARGNGYAYATS